MGYWKSQWISTDELKALTAIARIKDEGTLCRIVCECGEARVAEVAVAGIKDNQMLAALAADTNLEISVRKAALRNLTDQSVLCKAALCAENDSIAREAVSRLTDPECLRLVMGTCGGSRSPDLRAHALSRLLIVAEPDTVCVDEELLEWLLEDNHLAEYTPCIKALYRHTERYRHRIAQRKGRYTINSYCNNKHSDYGFYFDPEQ